MGIYAHILRAWDPLNGAYRFQTPRCDLALIQIDRQMPVPALQFPCCHWSSYLFQAVAGHKFLWLWLSMGQLCNVDMICSGNGPPFGSWYCGIVRFVLQQNKTVFMCVHGSICCQEMRRDIILYCSSNAQLVADVGCLGSVLFDFVDLSLSQEKKKSLTETQIFVWHDCGSSENNSSSNYS